MRNLTADELRAAMADLRDYLLNAPPMTRSHASDLVRDLVPHLDTKSFQAIARKLDQDRDLASVRDLALNVDLNADDFARVRSLLSVSKLGHGFQRLLVHRIESGLDPKLGSQAAKWAREDLSRADRRVLGNPEGTRYLAGLTLTWVQLALIAWAISVSPESSESAPAPRLPVLQPGEAQNTLAAAERPLAAFDQLAASGELAEWDESFIRNSIQQLELWGRRDDANPQIFELLVADLIRRFEDTLVDTSGLRERLIRLGAEESLAAYVSGKVSESLTLAMELGGDDAHADGELLRQLADGQAEIMERLQELDVFSDDDDSPDNSDYPSERAVVGDELTREATRRVVGLSARLLTDHWDQIRMSLSFTWHYLYNHFT